jgi:hypothetical protein
MVIEGERMGIHDGEIATVYTEQARTHSLYAAWLARPITITVTYLLLSL